MSWSLIPIIMLDGERVNCLPDLSGKDTTALAPLEIEWGRDSFIDVTRPAVAEVNLLSIAHDVIGPAFDSEIIGKRVEIRATVRENKVYDSEICLFDGFVSACKVTSTNLERSDGIHPAHVRLTCTDHTAGLESFRPSPVRLIKPTPQFLADQALQEYKEQTGVTNQISKITVPQSFANDILGPQHTQGETEYIDIPENAPTYKEILDIIFRSDFLNTWVYDPQSKEIKPFVGKTSKYEPYWVYGLNDEIHTGFKWYDDAGTVGVNTAQLRVNEIGFSTSRKHNITAIRANVNLNPADPHNEKYSIGTLTYNLTPVNRTFGESILEWTTCNAPGDGAKLAQVIGEVQNLPEMTPFTWRGKEFSTKSELRFWTTCWENGRLGILNGYALDTTLSRAGVYQPPVVTPMSGTVRWDGTQWEVEMRTRFYGTTYISAGPMWNELPHARYQQYPHFAPSITWAAMKAASRNSAVYRMK